MTTKDKTHVSPAIGEFAIQECERLRAENKRLREQLTDCTLFIREACGQKILDRAECAPLLKQWEAPLKGAD